MKWKIFTCGKDVFPTVKYLSGVSVRSLFFLSTSIHSPTYICLLPLFPALFSSGDNSKQPSKSSKRWQELKKKDKAYKRKRRCSERYGRLTQTVINIWAYCRCEVRGMAIKLRQVERGTPVICSPFTKNLNSWFSWKTRFSIWHLLKSENIFF